MTRKLALTIATSLAFGIFVVAAQRPNFSGGWKMDRARSFGMPGNMQQTMTVNQTGDQVELETKLIQPDNERTVKDSYVLDGKERDFTPPPQPNAPPNAPPTKGKRTANWLPNGNGFVVNEETTTEEAKPVTRQLTRKWTLSSGIL